MSDKSNDGFGGSFFDAIAEIIKAFLLNYLLNKWGIIDPIITLEECIKRKEWFKGVVLSTTFFESIGKRVLVDALKDKIHPNRLENLRLEQVIMFLFSIGKIEQSTYSKMMDVKKFRNNLVHLDPFTIPKIQAENAKKMIETATECISLLIEEWLESEKNLLQFLSELDENDNTKPNEKNIHLIEELDDVNHDV